MPKKPTATKNAKPAAKARVAKRARGNDYADATNPNKTTAARVSAVKHDPLAAIANDKNLQSVLNILKNKDEPLELRYAALQTLQAASFSVVAFEPYRGEYLAALRQVALDPDPELVQRVMGILAREKDGFVQKKLIEGLETPEKALVPPEKALQLLSYDLHADGYSVAREIVKNPPNTAAKTQALRLLAADATAAPLFEKLLLDKNETPEVRQLCATVLQTLKPQKFQEYAREIVLDSAEEQQLQATSLTALTNFGDTEAVAQDDTLLKRVDRMRTKGTKSSKSSARKFMTKYGQ